MKIALKYSLLVFVLMLAACNPDKKTDLKPNVIVLLVDDAGYADFGFAGCKDLETPNIDKLAANGVVFSDAHVSASVCGPSRAGLMTGRYQQRFGFECNPSHDFTGIPLTETTLAEALKQAGYTTAAFGKWHLGDAPEYRPNARGFDYSWGFLAGGRGYFSNKNDDIKGDPHAIQENGVFQTFEGYLTDCLGDKAVAFIEKNNPAETGKPFFMYWAPNAVHTPMHASEKDLARYKGHPRQTLAAMTWALDRAVGNIISSLEEKKLLENTLIFFLSDNGGAHNNQSSNKPLKGFKGNKFEGGHRVPFFVHWPKQIEAGSFNGLSSSLDIFATSIAVTGAHVETTHPLDGVNLIPYLHGKKKGEPHEKLFWRKDKMAAVRNNDLKLIRVENLGKRMYNLKTDLQEQSDLSQTDVKHSNLLEQDLKGWEGELMNPLWTEGHTWDTITWMIHEDLYLNREPRVKNPGQLNQYLRTSKVN